MTLSSDPLVPRQPVPPDPPMSARNKDKAHAMGLTSATGLVVGSIVGTGVFTMPAVLAGAGTMGIVVLGVIAVGAMMLAVLFGQLSKRVPNSDGGLYACSRHEFGDFAGISSDGATGSRPGPATPPSSRRGCSMSTRCSSSPIRAAWRTGALPWWDCGCRRS